MTELVRLGAVESVALGETHRDLLAPPAHEGRPHVALNFVLTADGRASWRGRAEIGTRTDRRMMFHLRRLADAVMIGAGTFRVDPFAPAMKDARSVAVVVSRSCDLPLTNRFFTLAAPRLIATVETADAIRAAKAAATGVEVARFGGRDVDLGLLLRGLHDRGVRFALCEGGPRLAGALLARRLVDELFLTHATLLTAEEGARRLFEGAADFPGARVERVALFEGQAGERYERVRVAYSVE